MHAINLVSIFNFLSKTKLENYQVGDSGTALHETMLYDRARVIPLLAILENRNDNGFVPKSMKNASQLSQIKQKRQRILDNRHQFPQNGWRNAIRSRTRLFIQPQNGLLNWCPRELDKRYLLRLMLLVWQSVERGQRNGFTLTHVNTLKELHKQVHSLLENVTQKTSMKDNRRSLASYFQF
jgi:hypothetical protein